MKHFISVILVFVMLSIGIFSVSVNAGESIEQDGLELKISTENRGGELLSICIEILNKLRYPVEDLGVELELSEDIELKNSSASLSGFDIGAEESFNISYEASFKTESGLKLIAIIICCAVIGIGILLLIIFAIKHKKSAKAVLSLFLCIGMLAPALHTAVNAENEEQMRTITVESSVRSGNEDHKIKATLTYSALTVDPTAVIKYDSMGAKDIPSESVAKGSYIDAPVNVEKEGFALVGWFEDPEEKDWSKCFNFEKTAVVKSMTLYARWIDSTKDSDKDGLYDDIEIYLGSDINDTDSDKDGLDDYTEYALLSYDPLSDDSDKDGITDAEEDYDEDTLTNAQETEYKTDLILADSDRDGLSDGEEKNKYSTDPLNVDTDGDAAGDGKEVEAGSDPLTKNTDFTEVESFGSVSEGQSVAVTVKTEVKGEQLGTLKIDPVGYYDNPVLSAATAGYIDNAVDISIDGKIAKAEVTFEYDPELGELGEDFQPRIYYYNEQTKTLEELPNQTVANGKVSVNINHFSTYILLNKVEFDKVWNEEIKPPVENGVVKNLDMVLLIDASGSMGPRGANNDPENVRLDVSKKMVGKTSDRDRVAVVEFGEGARVLREFTSDKDSVYRAIEAVGNTDTQTDMNTALNTGFDLFSSSPDSAIRYMILLTDGMSGEEVMGYTQRAKAKAITVFTVGLGDWLDDELLDDIASSTGGRYYHATKADALYDIYDDIAKETIDYVTDSNKDGISDYYTELIKKGELPLSNGSVEFIEYDFNYNENGKKSGDYDGDGLKNGEELIIRAENGRVYADMISDPTIPDTDGDGYSDSAEMSMASDPRVPSYSKKDVEYLLNDDNYTYHQVLDEEDKWYNELARQIWSTITANISHVDESKRVITDILQDYGSEDTLKRRSDEYKLECTEMIAQQIIHDALESMSTGITHAQETYQIIKYVKSWLAAGRSAKNLGQDYFGTLKAQLGLFKHRNNFKGFTFKAISKWDAGLTAVSFVLDESADIAEFINAYSNIMATKDIFEECRDILEMISSNEHPKEKFVTKAASDLLNLIDEDYIKFCLSMKKELEVSTLENVINVGKGLLGAANPYIAAINTIILILDTSLNLSDITENTYCLYVVDEIVDACKKLFTDYSVTESTYDFEYDQKKYLNVIVFSRLYGGKYAKNVINNQHFVFKNSKEIRENISGIIDGEFSKVRDCYEVINSNVI